jgi:hypothetical protein
MITIIAGSRYGVTYQDVLNAINESGFDITEVVSGTAKGADTFGELYSEQNNIPLSNFIPQWKTLGKKAGIVRNCDMGDYADALIAVWDGKSKGTKHMIETATNKGLKVYVYNLQEIKTRKCSIIDMFKEDDK